LNRYLKNTREIDGEKLKTVAIIVAHPDDETLWAGGNILNHPSWKCFIVCLCRASDKDRAPRFYNAIKILKSEGVMGNIDDGPDQKPLDEKVVESAIMKLLPHKHFDLVISHDPSGEYTRHIRHEETGKAVIKLWHSGKISTDELRTFAYEDGNKKYYPKQVENATIYRALTKQVWLKKYSIITETYGFKKNSWEAETTPRVESFWQFTNSYDAIKWLNNRGVIT
jgi:LmbE family N-acetylglucosaminyl deacetylase